MVRKGRQQDGEEGINEKGKKVGQGESEVKDLRVEIC